jgi:hypothetical protein
MLFFQQTPQVESTLQNQIIKHIESVQANIAADMNEDEILLKYAGHYAPRLVIGSAVDWALGESTSCYYTLYYHDIRMDLSRLQRTPAVTYNKGVLEIKADGSMHILDDKFNNSDAIVFPVFDGETLKLDFDYDEMENKQLACAII